MYTSDQYDEQPSGSRQKMFYLPVSSSSTRRNEIWEKKRKKKGVSAPNSCNKKYQRVAGVMGASSSRFAAPTYSFDKTKAVKPSYQNYDEEDYEEKPPISRDRKDVYANDSSFPKSKKVNFEFDNPYKPSFEEDNMKFNRNMSHDRIQGE